MNILTPALIIGGLGAMFGLGLAYASRKLCVVEDPKLAEVLAKLPGVNCGACGKPGCMGLAEALIKGECTVNQCTVANDQARAAISAILGVSSKPHVKTVAVLHCNGGSKVRDKFEYRGIRDCVAASVVHGGPKACAYGCIGFGTCAAACKFGAITMGADNLPIVHEDKCVACGACVSVCPKKLYTLVAATKVYAVRCMSLDFGNQVMDVCSVGCIGCGQCQKACPTGAAVVVNNLGTINYLTCDNRGECFKVCPRNSIAKKENRQWHSR